MAESRRCLSRVKTDTSAQRCLCSMQHIPGLRNMSQQPRGWWMPRIICAATIAASAAFADLFDRETQRVSSEGGGAAIQPARVKASAHSGTLCFCRPHRLCLMAEVVDHSTPCDYHQSDYATLWHFEPGSSLSDPRQHTDPKAEQF